MSLLGNYSLDSVSYETDELFAYNTTLLIWEKYKEGVGGVEMEEKIVSFAMCVMFCENWRNGVRVGNNSVVKEVEKKAEKHSTNNMWKNLSCKFEEKYSFSYIPRKDIRCSKATGKTYTYVPD